MSDFNITDELKNVPESSGVYLMYDAAGEILYIGKAKNLRRRISQYFQNGKKHGIKIERMVKLIDYFDIIVTDSETEALVLENNLIKEHRPRYNTLLKDDKTYPYIRLSLNEEYPKLTLTRNIKRDNAKYFGPYPDVSACREVIDLLNRTYRLKTCGRILPRDFGKERPCLNSHIDRCCAPCTGNVSKEEYAAKIREVKSFLGGNFESLAVSLRSKMKEASDRMEYEKAGEYKELLLAARKTFLHQKMESQGIDNRDVIGLARDDSDAVIQIFLIRGGKLLGRECYNMSLAPDETDAEILSSFVKQHYSKTPYVPAQILLQQVIEEADLIADWLTEKSCHRVQIVTPKRGMKEKMVELAEKNAELILENRREKARLAEARTKGAISEISKMLGIEYAGRIESYDISNISGYDSVASMVVYEDGKPKKSDYRKFRIKTVEGANDPASMAEVIRRRFVHSVTESAGEDSFTKMPNLLLIDGGKTQVNAVYSVLDELGLNIPVCGMVKDERHRTRGLLYNNEQVLMDRFGEPFKLITRIQDETHRFAIEYHKSLRNRGQVHSILDEIEGIGPKRRLSLMRHFKSLDAIKAASEEDLAKADGMNIKAARKVRKFFDEKERFGQT